MRVGAKTGMFGNHHLEMTCQNVKKFIPGRQSTGPMKEQQDRSTAGSQHMDIDCSHSVGQFARHALSHLALEKDQPRQWIQPEFILARLAYAAKFHLRLRRSKAQSS
jgi:hypothetical protein